MRVCAKKAAGVPSLNFALQSLAPAQVLCVPLLCQTRESPTSMTGHDHACTLQLPSCLAEGPATIAKCCAHACLTYLACRQLLPEYMPKLVLQKLEARYHAWSVPRWSISAVTEVYFMLLDAQLRHILQCQAAICSSIWRAVSTGGFLAACTLTRAQHRGVNDGPDCAAGTGRCKQ